MHAVQADPVFPHKETRTLPAYELNIVACHGFFCHGFFDRLSG
jgi:hypothetical protein